MRIVIAEDSVLLRAGLERLLTDAGHEVVSAVADASELLRAVTATNPDLAVVDVRMPPTFTDEGVRAAVLIRSQNPATAVLVLSQYVEERYAADLIAENTTGLGYLLKDRVADVEQFLDAVATVGSGGTALDPEVVAQILVRSRRSAALEQLTNREREVLQLMAEGASNRAISERLVVTGGAVEKHISSIFTKFGLQPEDSGNRRVLAVLHYLGGPNGLAAREDQT
ncbi:MAG TPA: response regulator transcription factor [Beutenbergiaceae bacterium]|nr:response regulator transcription factor [Beutenbergiaceae bacterium]